MSKPRVILADDHQIMAEGLMSLLEPQFEIVAIVSNGRELVAAARKHNPEAIVADISMPDLNGIEALLQLRSSGVASKVIFLTMHEEVAYARRAFEAGASGYVLKHSALTELAAALKEALRGKTYVSAMIAGELLKSYRAEAADEIDAPGRLTPRQREILPLFAEGRSAKEAAAILGISPRTAEFHRARILDALNLESTAELVHYAIRHGLITV
jgi:DNA-binding NarL/FixJ family response regulator